MLNIQLCLDALNEELKIIGRLETIYACGGSQLILLGCEGRETNDVDDIRTSFDEELLTCVLAVGKKFSIDGYWLNNQCAGLAKGLAKGWKEKTVILFVGTHLTVRGLSRQDLISTKLHALVNRNVSRDRQDLVWLKPIKTELFLAKQYCLKLAKPENKHLIESFIDAEIDSLL